MDETPSTPPAKKSPQIKLTLPTAEPIKNLFSRSPSQSQSPSPSPSASPTHKLLPSTKSTNDIKTTNLQIKCDTLMNTGSATGKHFDLY